MIRRIAAAILLVLSVLEASGNSFAVRVWQSEDGLPVNVVRSIVQAADGHLWIASAEGIARFDGNEFKSIAMPEGIRLPRFGPNRLFATPDGSVWLSAPRIGLIRFHDGLVEQILPGDRSPLPQHFTQVIPIIGERIVARRGEETWLVSLDPPILLAPASEGIDRAFAKDLEQRADRGRLLPDGQPDKLVDHTGHTWSNDPREGILVTSPDGVPISLDTGDFDRNLSASEFLEDREGNVWVASTINGLLRFRQQRAEIIDDSDGLSERSANAVIEDADGYLWIGMRSGGVDRIKDDQVEHFEFSPQTSGLRRTTSALLIDRDKRLWAAARDGSVFIWNGSAFEPAFPKLPIPSKVNAIHQDNQGRYWFGGANGLVKVEGGTITRLGRKDGVPRSHIICMAGDDSGNLWFGTMDGRVFRHEGDQIAQVGVNSSLSGRAVSALLVETPTRAWAATLGAGLLMWDGETWNAIDDSDGLPDSRLTCILTDEDDHFWLGSLGGIIRVPRRELISRIQNPVTPLHWLRIDRSDGLPTSECSGSSRPSGWRATDGKLYFPTTRGVVRIDPTSVDINLRPPLVYLRKFSADGVPTYIADDQTVTVGPGRTRLEFAYHGLNFSAPEKTSYRTRLIGLDRTWRDVEDQRISTFEAVPPGNYQFEVIAINGDGIWGNPVKLASIIIKPHFWETRWFTLLSILGVIAIAAGAGSLMVRIRLKRRIQALKINQALETERSRISRDLHDDLGASLTELSILSALALENPEDSSLRDPLCLISGKTKNVVSALDEIVWAATPSEDSLRSLVEYLAAFIREFVENAGMTLRTDIIRNIPEYTLGPNRRHNTFLATREAINNAVKYSKTSEIRVRIEIKDRHLVIHVKDDGPGFNPGEVVAGHGLENLRKRMSDCGGSCQIDSTPGSGTTVTLKLPLPELKTDPTS